MPTTNAAYLSAALLAQEFEGRAALRSKRAPDAIDARTSASGLCDMNLQARRTFRLAYPGRLVRRCAP